MYSPRRSWLNLSMVAICVIVLSIAISTVSSRAEEKAPLPYKAKTDDECIQEKECVWHAFTNQLGLRNYMQWVLRGKSIHKWNEDILFNTSGHDSEYLPILDAIRSDLSQYFPNKIYESNNSTFLIIFSSDVEKSFQAVAPKIDFVTGQAGKAQKLFEQAKRQYEGCLSLPVYNKETKDILSVLTIIDVNSRYVEKCMQVSYFESFGFIGYSSQQPFSTLSVKSSEYVKFTKLDKFLLYLLYQPEFKSGQQLKQVKEVFDGIYESSLNSFSKIQLKG